MALTGPTLEFLFPLTLLYTRPKTPFTLLFLPHIFAVHHSSLCLSWRWRHLVHPKLRQISTTLHDVTFKKNVICKVMVFTARCRKEGRSTKPTWIQRLHRLLSDPRHDIISATVNFFFVNDLYGNKSDLASLSLCIARWCNKVWR